jgi:hypothetical protein
MKWFHSYAKRADNLLKSYPKKFWQFNNKIDPITKVSLRFGLPLNLAKCKIMIYNKIHSFLISSYNFHDFIIFRCDGFVLDLGFKLSSSLEHDLSMEMVCCKALKTLGIIMRLSNDHKLTTSFKVLYCSLVRV